MDLGRGVTGISTNLGSPTLELDDSIDHEFTGFMVSIASGLLTQRVTAFQGVIGYATVDWIKIIQC